jgi:hypothetical protein
MAKCDLTGEKFGRLTVKRLSSKTKPRKQVWHCVCECGKTTSVVTASLRSGKTKSCGCLRDSRINNPRGDRHARRKLAIERYGEALSCTNPWYQAANRIAFKAKYHGIPFKFDGVMDFAIYLKNMGITKCPVFNRKFIKKGGKHNPFSMSIDRIDPRKGYTRGNVQLLSYLANAMKQNATSSQLKQFAKWALENN